jgi:hypothetical protein
VFTRTRKFVTSILATAMLAAGVFAPSAASQPNVIIGGGLVDVIVNDVNVLNNVKIGLGVALAADVCGVSVNVLAQDVRTGDATCTSDTGDVVIIQPA